ncbi:MAG: bifunctional ornithine acetyltransferase/N-acetylglutamate synthase [Sphaerochaetaceae bacterium]
MKEIEGGILAPKGYQVSAVKAGLKRDKFDLTLLVADCPATVAGAFTTNLVKAAPLVYTQGVVEKGVSVRAILVNSGNANAATGHQGEVDAQQSAAVTAALLGIQKEEVLLCSTGVIGVPLPMEKLLKGLEACTKSLANTFLKAQQAARAILTTDTFTKEVALEIELGGKKVRIGGMAKGSGMIHPNMATMLSFVTTDAAIERDFLQKLLNEGVKTSYNMISVDGDTSTNDTVLTLANGKSDVSIQEGSPEALLFEEAFIYVHTKLAQLIAKDGEGATKLITVEVSGGVTKSGVQQLARSIVSSNLVKTAFFGSDANWGRVLCAMGYAGVDFDPNKVSLSYKSKSGEIEVFKAGLPLKFDEKVAKEILLEREVTLLVNLNAGSASATAWGCDLSYEYVKINGDYRS